MIRQAITDAALEREIDHDPQFHWRGRNVTRIENLSDIVFALALGMIVAASETPVTVEDLKFHVLNLVPVTAAFAILLMIWNSHFVYFRRYGLGDGYAVFLNAVLLLFILFIAYPLRFIFDAFFAYALYLAGFPDRIATMQVEFHSAGLIMGVYAAGYAVIFAIIALMYRHALNKGDELGLSDEERHLTRLSVQVYCVQVLVSIAVFVAAIWTPVNAFAGFFYMLLWPAGYWLRARTNARIARLPAAGPGPETGTVI